LGSFVNCLFDIYLITLYNSSNMTNVTCSGCAMAYCVGKERELKRGILSQPVKAHADEKGVSCPLIDGTMCNAYLSPDAQIPQGTTLASVDCIQAA
jgi:hypothetical protein